ncbi:MAG: AsmA-like C-terminal region-containing protein, partial [Bacteroidales bacterium]|nr:AsmA-like C-terminal region-containing protein [Bacteroidales bacterium]
MGSKTDAVNFKMAGIPYLTNATLDIAMAVAADLINNSFTLKENRFSLNELTLGLDGTLNMPKDMPMNMDFTFVTKETSFKSLLSMVPAIYTKNFAGLKAGGTLQLDGHLKGALTEEVTPSANIKLQVKDAMFSYPDLPKSVNNINIELAVNYDGVNNDNTTLDLNKFHLEIAENPVDLVLNIKTPMSDPYVNGQFNIDLDLAAFADIVPLEETEIKGTIKSNIDFMGNMSTIEAEDYENFKAGGTLQLNNILYKSPDLPDGFYVTTANIEFSPKYVAVNNLNAGLGKSDFQFLGKLENFVPYMFDEKTVRGNFTFTSRHLDLNALMATEETPAETETADTASAPMAIVEVPANIDFKLVAKLDHILYDKIEITNAQGNIIVKDSRVVLDGFSVNMLGGSVGMQGEYNTQDVNSPMVDFALDIKQIDIPVAFKSLSMVQQFAPLAKNASGRMSTKFAYTSFLDQNMMPVLSSLVGEGRLMSN